MTLADLIAAIEALPSKDLAQVASRVALLRGSDAEPVTVSDEEERFYFVVCEAVRKRGVTMPPDEGKRMILLKASKLADDLHKACAACLPIATEAAPKALERLNVYRLLAGLALDEADRTLWHRNHRARLRAYIDAIRSGKPYDAVADMEYALDHWAPPAAHSMKQVLRHLQHPEDLLNAAFPGYGRDLLINVIARGRGR